MWKIPEKKIANNGYCYGGALSRLYQTGRIDEATSEAIASNVVCESFPMSDIEEH